jgi:hypothetical protein
VGGDRPGFVEEYDAGGKLVWRLEVLGMGRPVQRLPSGHTVVAHSGHPVPVVREYRPDKSVCWEVCLPGDPEDVQLLDGGNILAALRTLGRVVEVDRLGKVVWELKDLKRPWSCQRIDNGNTLISESNGDRVVEVDRGGKVVWSYEVKYPTHAQRLPDGHTVISNLWTVFEIDPRGKVLWEKEVFGISHASVY